MLWRLGCLNKKEVAKERNVVVRRRLWSSMSEAHVWRPPIFISLSFFFFNLFQNVNAHMCWWSTASSGRAILHVLTGVKRLASDNTALSATPSLDNYITPGLHCSHSLLIILLNSQWLESRWQRDKWQRGGCWWSPTPPRSPAEWPKLLSGNHGAVSAHGDWV